MGNLVLTCVPVVPLEQRVGDGPGGFEKMGEGSGGEKVANVRPTTFMSEVEGIHEPPTTLAKVLSNAVYAMAFHKHLALTNRSENYEFFQAVSHFAHETTANCQLTEAARKIYQLYVSETAPLRVDLDDGICRSIEKAIDGGKVTKDMFDPATMEVVSTMEKESLSEFLVSSTYLELRKRKEEGGLDKLLKEDLESIKDIMSKEFVEFLGDPGLSVVLSSKIGIDKFRQYLVIEFAEEGIDLLLATRSLLVKAKATKTTPASTATTTKKTTTTTTTTTATTPKEKGEGDVGDGIAEGEEDGGEKDVGGDGGAGGDGDGSQASTESGIVAPAAETPQEEGEGGGGGGRGGGGREGEEGALEGKKGEARDMPATTEENPAPAPAPAPAQEKQPDRGGGGEGVCDIQLEGKNIYERFIKSGCGAECNLPGTVVKKVSNVLANEGTTMEEIVQAFQVVEAEIFKLLAYDPFPRFKRSGMYTKYCMKARLHTQRSSLTHISEKSSCGNNSQSEISSRRFNMRE